jgi:hypothetical protein
MMVFLLGLCTACWGAYEIGGIDAAMIVVGAATMAIALRA